MINFVFKELYQSQEWFTIALHINIVHSSPRLNDWISPNKPQAYVNLM